MSSRPPNVLWVFADQLRHQALACNGDPNAQTPALDRIAAEGVVCETAVSHYPVCMPFRAGLMTGQYAHVHGLRVHGDLLAPGSRTVAHAFRQAGYRTSYVGKLHLASTNSDWTTGREFWVHPSLRAGFEDFFGFDIANHYYNTHYCTGETCRGIALDGHQTDGLTDLSLKYLAETALPAGRPWFHVIAYEAPHPGGGNGQNRYMPFPSPPEYEDRFEPDDLVLRPNVPQPDRELRRKTAGYYAMTAHLDHNVGRILALLADAGQLDSTLLVVLSDHGEMLGSHGRFNKEVAYDEAIRIPLIFRLPGTLPAGRRYDEGVVSGIDIFPTCAGLCGAAIFPGVQGMDLSAALRGRAGPRRAEALVQWLGATRYGWGDYPYRAIRTARHTYCVSSAEVNERHGGHYRLLFDNAADPYQQDNLFGRPEAAGLQRELHDTLCRTILASAEPLPDFVAERS